MKKNIYKQGQQLLKSKFVLGISAAMLLVSCTIQTGAYSETDGVYYDPSRDTLPEGVVMNGNRVGDYYDYQATSYPTDQNDIVYERYKDWSPGNSNGDSDWGTYAGAETNYYDSGWSYWGSPYFGWGYPGWSFGFGFGWGNWGWYNPYWSWYNPWYTGWYGSPWWGYGGYYSPYYYGYYTPYNGYYGHGYNSYNAPSFLRSGAVGNGLRSGSTGSRLSSVSGFRNAEIMRATTPQLSTEGSRGNSRMSNGFRGNTGIRPQITNGVRPQMNTGIRPRYNTERPNYGNEGFRGNSRPQMDSGDRGFRSGGFNNGGMRSSGSTGGGFRSSGGFSGGARSGGGGFRR